MSRSFFVRVCMFTVSNALLMSSATAMVRAGGILWLKPEKTTHHHWLYIKNSETNFITEDISYKMRAWLYLLNNLRMTRTTLKSIYRFS